MLVTREAYEALKASIAYWRGQHKALVEDGARPQHGGSRCPLCAVMLRCKECPIGRKDSGPCDKDGHPYDIWGRDPMNIAKHQAMIDFMVDLLCECTVEEPKGKAATCVNPHLACKHCSEDGCPRRKAPYAPEPTYRIGQRFMVKGWDVANEHLLVQCDSRMCCFIHTPTGNYWHAPERVATPDQITAKELQAMGHGATVTLIEDSK